MTVWDISNPQSPVQRGKFDLMTTVHNVFVMGRTAYMSHYREGVQIVDLADPTKPTMVASYDTSNNFGFGCWGIHAFSDHGLIYATDQTQGLYVLQIDCGHMNRYEKGTVGSTGLMPRARFDGATPRVGAAALRIEVENLQPNAPLWLLAGPNAGKANLLGVQVNVDLSTAVIKRYQADTNGNASLPAPIPNAPGLANTRIYMQVVALDTGNANGFSASRGFWTGLCR